MPEAGTSANYVDCFSDQKLYLLDLGLACCAIESEQSVSWQNAQSVAPDAEILADACLVIVISGTLTNPVAQNIAQIISWHKEKFHECKVVAFGACAIAGGPYWDSYSVTLGADQLVQIDYYLPGCPPHPEVLTNYLTKLHGELLAGQVVADEQ